MKHPQHRLTRSFVRPALLALFTAFAVLGSPHGAAAQTLTLANPHWNITLSDFGYSDYLLDNTDQHNFGNSSSAAPTRGRFL